MRRFGVGLQPVQHLSGRESLDEIGKPVDVGRFVEQLDLAFLPPTLEHGAAQHHQLVHLDAFAARASEHVGSALRSLASVAGQPEDRVADREQPTRARAAHRILEFRDRVQAVDVDEPLVVGALQPELDPHRQSLVPAREHVERGLRQRVGARGDAEGHDFVAHVRLDEPQHLLEPPELDVRVGIGLEIGDRRAGVLASRDTREARAELLGEVGARTQRARARTLDVAVHAAAEALRAVAVGALGARVQRDAVQGRAETLARPVTERAEAERRHRGAG